MDQVVGYPVFSALPNEDAWRMPIVTPDMVDMVSGNIILKVYVFCPGAITAKQDSDSTKMTD
jgi:hypothetical protein